jgi:hypothetical protein
MLFCVDGRPIKPGQKITPITVAIDHNKAEIKLKDLDPPRARKAAKAKAKKTAKAKAPVKKSTKAKAKARTKPKR